MVEARIGDLLKDHVQSHLEFNIGLNSTVSRGGRLAISVSGYWLVLCRVSLDVSVSPRHSPLDRDRPHDPHSYSTVYFITFHVTIPTGFP